jgi:hypothetical protein
MAHAVRGRWNAAFVESMLPASRVADLLDWVDAVPHEKPQIRGSR